MAGGCRTPRPRERIWWAAMAGTMELEERALGLMLGLACGDALGGPLEFQRPDDIIDRHGGVVREMIGGGWLGLRPGQITDDTQLALCLARAIADHGGYSAERAAANYVQWYRSDPLDVGSTTSAALRGGAQVVGTGASLARACTEAARAHWQRHPRGCGNGSLMRIAPLAIAHMHDPNLDELARQDSALTHYAHEAQEACAYFVCRLAELLDGREVRLRSSHPLLDGYVGMSPQQAAMQAQGPIGYVLTALAVGMCAYRHAGSFEEGLVWAVNLGGDTDTNGAVAGAILGARFGASQIPKRWLARLEHRIELERLAMRLLSLASAHAPHAGR